MPAHGSWTIPSDHALLAIRQGGQRAQEGFLFQRAYATHALLDLLDRTGDLDRVRWEGLEDIDLSHAGTCSYVQVKHGDIDKPILLDVLRRFEEGWKAACGSSRFLLVHPKGTRAPRRWPQYVLRQFPAAFLDVVETKTVPDTQELLNAASVRLSRMGVASSQLDNAVRALLQLLSVARVELSASDVRQALSPFPRALPPEELQAMLAAAAGKRIRGRLGPAHLAGPRVDRPAAAAIIEQFVAGEKRLLILKGLPGAGKTTLLLATAEREPAAVLTSCADVSPAERWSAQLDRDLQLVGAPAAPSFLQLCNALADRKLLILVDQVERAADPVAALEQVISDLSLLPPTAKVIAAIRWANLPTQAEAHVASRDDVAVAALPELDDDDLVRFMDAFGLPQQVPDAARRMLRTPFAVRLLAASPGERRRWENLGSAMREYFRNVMASTPAKELFLDAVGAAAIRMNHADAIPVREILAAARDGLPLTLADCDSEAPYSSLRCFIDRGILTEGRDGIRATHDLWMEHLAARALQVTGMPALVETLLETDWGIRWSCVPMLAELLPEDELRALVQALILCIHDCFDGLSAEEKNDDRLAALRLQHLAMREAPSSDTPRLRHLMELQRAETAGRPSLARASRAAVLLASLFSVDPNVVGECAAETHDHVRAWLLRSMLPSVVLDPYAVQMVDRSRRDAVRFVLSLQYVLAISSVGLRVSTSGAEVSEITIRAFEGRRLPSMYNRLHMNGMHLVIPSAFHYFPAVLPSLLGLAEDLEDTEITGLLEMLADYSAVAIATRQDSTDYWRRLVASLPVESLGSAGFILGSTYPHVDPRVLHFAAIERLQNEPASYPEVRRFIHGVVVSAIAFCLVDLEELSLEKRWEQFARAVDLWRLDVTVDGVTVMARQIDALTSGAERVAVLCLLFLLFQMQLETSADGPKLLKEIIDAQIKNIAELLRTTASNRYAGFDLECADPSRIPLALSAWLQHAGRSEEAAELLDVGERFAQVCDGWFGIPRDPDSPG